ncbi:MAG: hypothetical protein KC492_19865, partial [Myxococcales bacterium]|nr:hypothetical protein [Myxococcales bacterium]
LAMRSLLESLALVAANPALGHHLSKGSIESWLALELAFQLDPALEPLGWTCLVEERRMDLLMIPRGMEKKAARLSLSIGSAPAIGVEIREAKLAQGQTFEERVERLTQDLSKLGPSVQRFGVLLTTDGSWSSATADGGAKSKGDAVDRAEPLQPGLRRIARLTRQVVYRGFAGRLWFDVVMLDGLRGSIEPGPSVSWAEIAAFAERAERMFPVPESVEEQAKLAASARAYYDQYGELPKAHTVVQRCLCFEQRKLRDVGREAEGDELEYQIRLYEALLS